MRLYMSFRTTHDATIAAGKSGFSRASGYRIEDDPRLPSQKKVPRNRRRVDPFARFWEVGSFPNLDPDPGNQAIEVIEELRLPHPMVFTHISPSLGSSIREWGGL